ncbi:hypothetical protein [Shimia aestuarii]|uniref:LPS sulfotransferase NodH n=1 Tax=Shimia aestuarii TaxID=254406 RepID=A0A1I4TWS3_9RHOB|nr:hypothetical protein [Shimia aestuarii]SFM81077.1 hypothetical protein SAMN04488042_1244 [Shimia aestuarii]
MLNLEDVREITIVAAPRSGTNYFCDTLGAFEENAAFLELFSPEGVFGVSKYEGILAMINSNLGTQYDDPQDKSFVNFVRQAPLEFLAALKAAVAEIGKTAFSYKIFADQLNRPHLREILESSNRHVLFVVRNRIDSYISFCKAREKNVWVNQDTSDLKIEIDFHEFMEWAAKLDRWYAETEAVLREAGRKYSIFSYDADINVPKGTLVEKQYIGLRSVGVDMMYPKTISKPMFSRQDKPSAPFSKIINGEELRKEFVKRKLLATYALRNPMVNAQ